MGYWVKIKVIMVGTGNTAFYDVIPVEIDKNHRGILSIHMKIFGKEVIGYARYTYNILFPAEENCMESTRYLTAYC